MCFTWWVFQGAVNWHGSGLKVRPDVPSTLRTLSFCVLPRLLVCCQPTKAEHSGARYFGYAGPGICILLGSRLAILPFQNTSAPTYAFSDDRKKTWGNGNKMYTLFMLKKAQYNGIINKP